MSEQTQKPAAQWAEGIGGRINFMLFIVVVMTAVSLMVYAVAIPSIPIIGLGCAVALAYRIVRNETNPFRLEGTMASDGS
jgi:hypothetical protein